MRRAFVLLGMVLAGTGHAATLRELLDAAEKQNLDRQISREQREKAAAEVGQGWSALLPSLTAQGSWTHNQYPTEITVAPGAPKLVITPSDQFDGVVRAELPLLDTGRWFRALAAGALGTAADYRDEASRDAIRRQVATTYYGYAAALAVRESAQRSLAVARAQHELQQVREKAGASTTLEVLRARAEYQRNLQTVADTDNLVATTQRALRTLTGIGMDENAVLPADDFSPDGSLEDLEARADELPGVRAADKDAEAAGRLAWASRLAFVPSVSAQFTERFTNATGFSGHDNIYGAGLGLTWRLDGPMVFGTSASASQHSIAELGAERLRVAARDLIHNEWRRLQAAMEKVTAARAQVESAQKAAQVARDRYAVGASTQIDVISAERDLFSAEVNQIQSRTDLASSHVSLRIAAGLPLKVD